MTLMADTRMTDEWIKRAVEQNPIVLLESGNYRTCPVRLSFPNLFERSKPIPPATEGSFGANLIFPVGVDRKLLEQAAVQVLKEKCPDALSDDPKRRVKVKNPFKDQGEMLKYEGYLEGGWFISATSRQNQPALVDMQGKVVTDRTKVYPGVWAVATIRPFWYDKGVNKGVSFGLQSVMIIADDNNLGGGGEDLSKAFAGIKLDAGDVDTSSLFG